TRDGSPGPGRGVNFPVAPQDQYHVAWIGTVPSGSGVDQDAFTKTLSHELVETITDPDNQGTTVQPAPGLAYNLRDFNPSDIPQVADFEPDSGRYTFRVNGDLVQAYWSYRDQAYIVPDGDPAVRSLLPIWNNTGSDGPQFTGTYDAVAS